MFAVASVVYQLNMIAAYTSARSHAHTIIVCSLTRKIAFRCSIVLYWMCVCVCVIHAKIHVMDCPSSGLWSLRIQFVWFGLVCLPEVEDAVAIAIALLLHISIHFYYTFYGGDIICSTHTLSSRSHFSMHRHSITFANFRSKNLLKQWK